jgi:predicted metal-dependent peptidase
MANNILDSIDELINGTKDQAASTVPEYSISQDHIDRLTEIKDKVLSIYRGGRNKIQVNNCGDYPLETNELGNCRVYHFPTHELYSIHHGQVEPPPSGSDPDEVSVVDFLIIMHEFGHIILGHMNNQKKIESMIDRLFDTIEEKGDLLAEKIAKNCGIEIDLAEQLLTRLIDDTDLLHELLNISMDMSVNTCILEENDIHYMEQQLVKKLKSLDIYGSRKEKMISKLDDMATDEYQKEIKERLRKELERLRRRFEMKFILPSRYKLGVDANGVDIPFPDGKAFDEYFNMIIAHLDQFVRFLAALRLGKSQDQITSEDMANELEQEQKEFEYKKGYRQANVDYHERLAGKSNRTVKDYPQESEPFIAGYNKSIEDIAEALLNEQQNNGGGQQGQNSSGEFSQEGDSNSQGNGQPDPSSNGEGSDSDENENGEDSNGMGNGDEEQSDASDHENPELNDFLKNLRDSTLGDKNNPQNITNHGGKGRSTQEMPAVFRQVVVEADQLTKFLIKLGKDYRQTVVSMVPVRNVMYKHNRRMGSARNSKIITPTISIKMRKDVQPRVVFLIDVSGSMDTDLIDRVLKTISVSLKKISTKVRYDVITWHTSLATHYRDLDPRHPLTSFPCGGGTRLGEGIKYFGLHYKKNCPLIVISDFDDDLNEWNASADALPGYELYGINYGYRKSNTPWRNFKEFKFD